MITKRPVNCKNHEQYRDIPGKSVGMIITEDETNFVILNLR